VYEGTWSSGPVPAELEDFELMREMHWSWAELQAAPVYVRRFCWDFTLARRGAENAAAEREKGRAGGGAGT
jgi:hypothetical protein